MSVLRVAVAVTVGVLPLIPSRAEVPPVASHTARVTQETPVIPPAPSQPKQMSFPEEADGRRLFFDARDALQNGSALAYNTRIIALNNGATGDRINIAYRTEETVKAQLGHHRLSITTDTKSGNTHSVRRTVANDTTIISSKFEEQTPATTSKPTRTFQRLNRDEGVPLPRYVAAVNGFPTAVGTLLLLDFHGLPRETTLWRDASRPGDVLVALDPLQGRPDAQTRRARQYTLEPRTRRLLRYEEWTTSQREPRPARKNRPADTGLRVSYRREDYVYAKPPATDFPAVTFSPTVPGNYQEVAVAADRVPQPTVDPVAVDPKATALLNRWRTAQERYLTYAADIEQRMRITPRTATSRPIPPERASMLLRYSVTTQRSGLARVTQETVEGSDRRGNTPSALYVSDGEQIAVQDRTTGQVQKVRLDNPDQLWGRLARMGLTDWGNGIGWIFAGTLSGNGYDKVSYEGRSTINGETVDTVLLERTTNGRGRRGVSVANDLSTRIFFGADGLPRQIEMESSSDIESGVAYDRDQPPIMKLTTTYRNIRIDREPLPDAFKLPAGK